MTLAQNKGMNPIDAWNNTQVYLLNALANAYGELFIVQSFHAFIMKLESEDLKTNKDTKEAMIKLYQLFCLSRIEQDLGTFRDGDYLTTEHGDMVRQLIIQLCSELKRHIVPIVETFYPGDEMMDSMIAPSNGDLYGSIVNKIYGAPKAFERIGNWHLFHQK